MNDLLVDSLAFRRGSVVVYSTSVVVGPPGLSDEGFKEIVNWFQCWNDVEGWRQRAEIIRTREFTVFLPGFFKIRQPKL